VLGQQDHMIAIDRDLGAVAGIDDQRAILPRLFLGGGVAVVPAGARLEQHEAVVSALAGLRARKAQRRHKPAGKGAEPVRKEAPGRYKERGSLDRNPAALGVCLEVRGWALLRRGLLPLSFAVKHRLDVMDGPEQDAPRGGLLRYGGRG